jgi:hypothetical protein
MAFDPSVIGSIGDNSIPDVSGAVTKGFQLRDLVTTDALKRLELRQTEQQMSDTSEIKRLTKGKDITKADQASALAGELSQHGYAKEGMDVLKTSQDIQAGETQNKIAQVDLALKKTEWLGSQVNPVYEEASLIRSNHGTDTEVSGVINARIPQITQAIKDAPDNVVDPAMRQRLLTMIQQHQGPWTFDQLRDIYRSLPKTTAQLQQQKADLVAQQEETHRKVSETQGQERIDAEGKQVVQVPHAADASHSAPYNTYDIIDKKTGQIKSTGAEAAPKGSAVGGGGRMAVYNQRIINAVGEATKAAHSLGTLGIDAQSRGVFPSVVQGLMPLKVTGEILNNQLSDQNVQLYNDRMAGLARQLGTLETSGLAAQGVLTQGLDQSIRLQSGDTIATRLDRMAEIRQIVDTNIDSTLTNPGLSQEQKDFLVKMKGELDKSIPITHDDVDRLLAKRGQKGYSLADAMKDTAAGGKGDTSGGSMNEVQSAAQAELKRRQGGSQ